MVFEDIKERLESLIESYIADSILQEDLLKLLKEGQGVGMKGLIYSLDEHKVREFTSSDKEFLKEVFFYFV